MFGGWIMETYLHISLSGSLVYVFHLKVQNILKVNCYFKSLSIKSI